MRSSVRGIRIIPPDPAWAGMALAEMARLEPLLGINLIRIEHIGSTAIPGIYAKPIIDLMPLVHSIPEIDMLEESLEAAGYNWYGEYGLPGRRYLNRDDLALNKRIANIHIYAADNPEVDRHLGFRDYLRAHPNLAQQYAEVKVRCAGLHSDNVDEYNDCKDPWIKSVEAAALVWYRNTSSREDSFRESTPRLSGE